ncbi:bifunctional hydroxymethylpyrimidine kinase/phosphomethylpyrimidine kinase [Bacillus bombysepticus]|uniref:pyridoxal kinase n=3 Tax=Bacillus cereus group TaxID=86661 RepID=A0A9X6JNV2_BACUK|nr:MULTISPECIES: bifunctional hydroxymethylpyrimidine kinase/phosphomethylpyrimidine kinase [Bacillus cereus group]MBY0040460.1 bifunctional hydroxymethylpyrimidine kinase/phosphomethylpyrimidine kinase [Bacillus cereus]MEC2873438.1 bifunctional hydroxymethylpyrimidine kinase/phosphomethylpyrimidine kinase [Bacillus cereus]OTZ71066.1 bifunctional hydroxymethylpyrimidine kinase/phosphomethylpyrimidine kinase [Bacillus thuringiensis serovar kumamtoensis]OTZ71452.1 bifunctional hydroxymethylpyrimi
MTVKKVLTIAGSDSSGGAGLQADLKTFEEYGTFGLTAITTIVTMDPNENWRHNVYPIEKELVQAQLKTIFSVGKLDAMKTGMLGSIDMIKHVRDVIETYEMQNVVIDPVMVCKGENEPLYPENGLAMRDFLLPKATIVTPNLFEAGQLSGLGNIKTVNEMKEAAKRIIDLGAQNVVIKGGKSLENHKATDLLYDGVEFVLYETEKVQTNCNHGAGCTFAAAITAGLAKGLSVQETVAKAKDFVTEGIKSGFALNTSVGPVWHGAYNKADLR